MKYTTIPKLFYFPLVRCSEIWLNSLVNGSQKHLPHNLKKKNPEKKKKTGQEAEEMHNRVGRDLILNKGCVTMWPCHLH